MRTTNTFLVAAIAAVAIGLHAEAAKAQSGACLRLSNQLAAIDSGGGFDTASSRFSQYDQAVRDQQAQIAKTERAARLNGCFGFFSLNRSLCDRIRSSLDQMQANLTQLTRTRNNLGGQRANNAERNAIVREMDRLGCVRNIRGEPRFANQEPRRRSLLEQIFGVRTYREDGFFERNELSPDLNIASRYGTFRTLCVRKCDGYYFPISFSTSRQLFDRDSTICQSMCPDTDVELYVHGQPDQESEDMVSWLTGEPYTKLPAAFSYRKKVDSQCTCSFRADSIAEISGSGGLTEVSAIASEEDEKIPIPRRRIDPGIDPETAANTEGGLTAEQIISIGVVKKVAPQPLAEASGKIRVVGPEFFPAQ